MEQEWAELKFHIMCTASWKICAKVSIRLIRVMNDLHSQGTPMFIINTEKTTVMSFILSKKETQKNLKPHLTIWILLINQKEFLGIYTGKNMKQDSNTKPPNAKLSKSCYMLQSLKQVTSSHYNKYLFCISSCSFEVWFNFLGW
jgi:hypothetical protein